MRRAAVITLAWFIAGCSDTGFVAAPAVGADAAEGGSAAVATPVSKTVAFRWNQVLLAAIRADFARPTVHARNLFHVSAAMYDAWALYDGNASTWLAGASRAGHDCPLDARPPASAPAADRHRAISHAAYRLIRHRFARSPGALQTVARADALMGELGYDLTDDGVAVETGSAAAFGNRVAQCYIDYGLQDGANEAADYGNLSYRPVNPPLAPHAPGNPTLVDPDRWQPLSLPRFIDQSGHAIDAVPGFLGAEWGRVQPFALAPTDRDDFVRDGTRLPVYLDPGPPPLIADGRIDDWRWNFSLVAAWAAHLDPSDGVMIDISPASLGNIGGDYLHAPVDPRRFHDFAAGGDPGRGRALNPATGRPYERQWVARGDYARALAEFWADGPESETPPGHWFVILNDLVDHPGLDRSRAGPSDPLEWIVKAYLAMGGAMHDAAIAAWSVKGRYDFIRPISAIRAMAARGQASDPALPSYSPLGMLLEPGRVELVAAGDPLAGAGGEHVGKIKLRTWRGPAHVADPRTDVAGVGWILAEHWWPYQRPSFVTPPFAGYVSGHSTFSSAAATVLERLTGDPYFPGGLAEYPIEADAFLVFERGPRADLTLQWATYRDAADQCSLSRIWGGIHPPADDLPGRRMGLVIGERAVEAARRLFAGGA